MEKFGIFELLDTLSALILPDGGSAPPPETAPKRDDAAFAPPAYGDAQPARGDGQVARGDAPAKPESTSATALSSFLERHEKAVKKLDGKS